MTQPKFKKMTKTETQSTLTILGQTALSLASTQPWDQVTLSDLCAASDIELSACATFAITKADISAHVDALLDQAMLNAQTKVDRSQSVKDRLFDVLMGRFDAMEDNRAAWVSILSAEKSDIIANLARQARRIKAGAWALEASGVTASHALGLGQSVSLGRILRQAEGVWVHDGPDLAKTMANLDQKLRMAEEWSERLAKISAFLKPKPAAEPTL